MTSSAVAPVRPTTTGADRSRLLLLAGPVYTGLLVLAVAAFPAPPHGDVAAATQPVWLGTHTGAVIAQAYVRALAALAFAVMGTTLAGVARRRAMPVTASFAATGAALTGGFMLLAQVSALGSAQLSRSGGGGDAIRVLGQLQEAALNLSSLPAALLFGATGLTVVRSADLPRWVGGLSLLGVPLALVDATSYDGGPLAAAGLVGLVYFLAWSVITGVRLAWVPRILISRD